MDACAAVLGCIIITAAPNYVFTLRARFLNSWTEDEAMILPGYQTSDSATSSKFHHLALACLACGASVAL